MQILQSDLCYVLPLNTETLFHGSKIVAISVIRDLSSLLDDMAISSFDGQAYLYLTQYNGVAISRLTHGSAEVVYNVISLLRESDLYFLTNELVSLDEMLASDRASVLLRKLDRGDQYVVITPVKIDNEEMWLFYFVPETTVNRTANSFSKYMIQLSTTVIFVVAISAIFLVLFLYKLRKIQFNRALSIREYMMDLLVRNSKSAFFLMQLNKKEPLFISSNAQNIIGERCHSLEKTETGFRLHGAAEPETAMTSQLNEQLRDWDGVSTFRSRFIRNTASLTSAFFEVQIIPVDDDKEDITYIEIAQDVTPLYARETAVSEALTIAEQASKAKSRFLSNMSHDIRTPMNAIVNMAIFAKESIGDVATQREYLNTLSDSANQLLQLINDVLDMSRIESGQMVFSSEPFDLKTELGMLANTIRPLCEAKQQTFIVDDRRLTTPMIVGDKVKLSQIITNLLSNANKYTPNGGAISFTAESISSIRDDMATVRFKIQDNGIGIKPEYLQKIFEPFARIDNERVGQIEGTGLGLSICHSYVLAMGGTIHCTSELGKGSLFTVELFFPKAKTEPESQTSPDSAGSLSKTPFAGKRCLLCEDHAINRLIAVRLLEKLGFAVETAIDGQEGVNLFLHSQPGYYDVIYIDIQMPVMDGYRATAAIRESDHAQAKTVPIIAMTANVFAEDVERARAAGMNGHTGKPLVLSELIKVTNESI